MTHRTGLLLATALIGLTANASHAATGINLSWDDCGPAGVSAKSFACDTNAGTHVLVGSFEDSFTPTGVDSLTGIEAVLYIDVSGDSVPDWWHFKQPGTCRETSLSLLMNFPAMTACADYWASRTVFSGFGYIATWGLPTRARLALGAAVPYTQAGGIPLDVEHYAFRLVINNAQTVGPGACYGCFRGATITLDHIKLTTTAHSTVGDLTLTAPLSQKTVTWQGGFVPVLNRSWGAIKRLYR